MTFSMCRAGIALSVWMMGFAAATASTGSISPAHGAGIAPRETEIFFRRRGGDDHGVDDRDAGATRGDSVRGASGGGGASSARGDERSAPRPADKAHGSDQRIRDDDGSRIGR